MALYSLGNFVKTPEPGDKQIYIYDINGRLTMTLDPYVSTFYNKYKYVYIISEGRQSTNLLLEFSDDGEAEQAVYKLDDVKKYFLSTEDMYSKSEIDLMLSQYASINNVYFKTEVYNTGETIQLLDNLTLDSLKDVDTGGTQQGYYLSYSAGTWVGVQDATDLSNYYNKQQVDNLITGVTVDLSGYYTSAQTDAIFSPTSHTHTVFNNDITINGTLTATTKILTTNDIAGAVQAQFGTNKAFYITANWPTLAFNAYYDSGWRYGQGSNSEYGGFQSLNPSDGEMNYYLTTDPGDEGDAANIRKVFAFYPNGDVVIPKFDQNGLVTTDSSGYLNVDTTTVPLLYSHTGETNPHGTGFNDLSSTAHTHDESYYLKNQVYNTGETNSILLGYTVTGTSYNKNEVYNTGETYSKDEVDNLLTGVTVGYYTSAQTDSILLNYTVTGTSYNKNEVYNTGETYTRLEVDDLLTGVTVDLSAYYTTAQTYSTGETNSLLSGYTVTGTSYTKNEVYNTGETFTKLEVNNLLTGFTNNTANVNEIVYYDGTSYAGSSNMIYSANTLSLLNGDILNMTNTDTGKSLKIDLNDNNSWFRLSNIGKDTDIQCNINTGSINIYDNVNDIYLFKVDRYLGIIDLNHTTYNFGVSDDQIILKNNEIETFKVNNGNITLSGGTNLRPITIDSQSGYIELNYNDNEFGYSFRVDSTGYIDLYEPIKGNGYITLDARLGFQAIRIDDNSGSTNIEIWQNGDANFIGNFTASTIYANLDWLYLTNTPTTISGYNITDAYNTGETYTKLEVDNLLTGITVDLSAYYTSAQTNSILLGYYTSAQTDQLLSGITVDLSAYYTSAQTYNTGETYTKLEVDNLLTGVTTDLSAYYTSAQTDSILLGYTITGTSYTKNDVYNTGETNSILLGYTVTGTSYTKNESNANFLSANTFNTQVNYNINTSGNITGNTINSTQFVGGGTGITGVVHTFNNESINGVKTFNDNVIVNTMSSLNWSSTTNDEKLMKTDSAGIVISNDILVDYTVGFATLDTNSGSLYTEAGWINNIKFREGYDGQISNGTGELGCSYSCICTSYGVWKRNYLNPNVTATAITSVLLNGDWSNGVVTGLTGDVGQRYIGSDYEYNCNVYQTWYRYPTNAGYIDLDISDSSAITLLQSGANWSNSIYIGIETGIYSGQWYKDYNYFYHRVGEVIYRQPILSSVQSNIITASTTTNGLFIGNTGSTDLDISLVSVGVDDINNNFNDIASQYNKLRADHEELKSKFNTLLGYLQNHKLIS